MSIQRESALSRRNVHPAESLPSRDEVGTPAPATSTAAQVRTDNAPAEERLSATHNTRVRPSTKTRVDAAVPRHQIATGDKTVSLASITDIALTEWLERHNY